MLIVMDEIQVTLTHRDQSSQFKKKKKRTKAMKTPPNRKMKSGESETISINPQKNSDGQ